LFAYVMGLLMLPKLLAVLLIFRTPEKWREFGGRWKLLSGALGEMFFAALLAPILMLFHTRFVLSALTGAQVKWGGQKRDAGQTPPWRDCVSRNWANTAFVVAWALVVAWFAPALLPWMAFVFLGPLVAIPFTYVTALKGLAQRARDQGWFVIPEEIDPPAELMEMGNAVAANDNQFFQSKRYAADFGLLQAVLDPYCNAVHTSLLRQRDAVNVRTHHYLGTLGERLLRDGPAALTPEEKYALLWDSDSMGALHRKLWRSPASSLHEWWATAFRRYNETLVISARRTLATH